MRLVVELEMGTYPIDEHKLLKLAVTIHDASKCKLDSA